MTPWFEKRKLHMVAIVTAFGLVVAVVVPTEHNGKAAQTANISTLTMNTISDNILLKNTLTDNVLTGNVLTEKKLAENNLSENTLINETLVANSLMGYPTLEEIAKSAKSNQEFQMFASNEVGAGIVSREITDVNSTEEEMSDVFSIDDTEEPLGGIVADGETAEEATDEIEEAPAPEFYSVGVTHSSVAEIQQQLMDLGFMDYAEPTNYYGPITSECVMLFQRQNDLKQDGIIGPETKAMLLSKEAKKYTAKLGMSGVDITRIQTRLYEMGYLAASNQVTGTFDEKTEAAVIKMQENNGLAADGKVGLVTAELLYSGEAKSNLLSYGDNSEIILSCQQRLKELGYLTTKPDGSYGKDTEAAVKQFQSKNDIVVDGYLGPTTRDVLNSSSAVANGLMLGDSGDLVQRVQELLSKYGYISADNATGYFGEITENAVIKFQKNNGLTADGNVGVKTMSVLSGSDVVKASSSNSSSSSSNGTSNEKESSDDKKDSSSDDGASSDTENSSSTSASVSSLLDVARSKVGSPYVYGSKGPNSFDCSGFVYYCLNKIGVRQSYLTSSGWRNVGKYQKVSSFSNIKAGDIIVVRGHVGIAAGNGMVIDASSSSGKIVKRELGSWWQSRFIVAWRIFD